jgi:hypothetical protein
VLTHSFIFDIKYFALATLPDVCTAFIMRFLTCADSDADTAVGCDGEDGDEDDEEPKGLRPPKDIFDLRISSRVGRKWTVRFAAACWSLEAIRRILRLLL